MQTACHAQDLDGVAHKQAPFRVERARRLGRKRAYAQAATAFTRGSVKNDCTREVRPRFTGVRIEE